MIPIKRLFCYGDVVHLNYSQQTMKPRYLRVIFLIGFIALIVVPVWAQIKVKPGIYRSFTELRHVAPSAEFTYRITEVQWEYETGKESSLYQINASKDALTKLGEVYGFCLAGKFYYNLSKHKLASENQFVLIEVIGPYFYFEEIVANPDMVNNEIVIRSKKFERLIDTRSGAIITLTPQTVTDILAGNKTLQAQFGRENQPDMVMKHYLVQLYSKSK